MSEDRKTSFVKQVLVVGYHFGRANTGAAFLLSLDKHGLRALGCGYAAGPVLFFAEGSDIKTDVDNAYHLEKLVDDVEFTNGTSINSLLRESFKMFLTEQLSKDIAHIVTPFLTPTAYDKLGTALHPWFEDFVRGDAPLGAGSWGLWRLTECRDDYPALIEYAKKDGQVLNYSWCAPPTLRERRRLAVKGIHFPKVSCLDVLP